MCRAVLALLLQKNVLWQARKGLSKAVSDLGSLLNRADKLAAIQAAKDGAAAEKAQALQRLGDLTFIITAGTKACASDSKNKYLAGQMAFTRAQISDGADATIVARCTAIYDGANAVVGSLADYGIEPAHLTELEQAIQNFAGLRTKPRQVTASSSAATKELAVLLRRISELLNERLDTLMVQFKDSEAAFFNEYRSARITVQRGARGTEESNVVPVPVAVPAAKAA